MANTTEDKLTYLKETKTAIKDAIVAKGVDVPRGTTFREYAGKIGEIKTGVSLDLVPFEAPQNPPQMENCSFLLVNEKGEFVSITLGSYKRMGLSGMKAVKGSLVYWYTTNTYAEQGEKNWLGMGMDVIKSGLGNSYVNVLKVTGDKLSINPNGDFPIVP